MRYNLNHFRTLLVRKVGSKLCKTFASKEFEAFTLDIDEKCEMLLLHTLKLLNTDDT